MLSIHDSNLAVYLAFRDRGRAWTSARLLKPIKFLYSVHPSGPGQSDALIRYGSFTWAKFTHNSNITILNFAQWKSMYPTSTHTHTHVWTRHTVISFLSYICVWLLYAEYCSWTKYLSVGVCVHVCEWLQMCSLLQRGSAPKVKANMLPYPAEDLVLLLLERSEQKRKVALNSLLPVSHAGSSIT